jgi:hypothetical protein
VIGFVHLVPRLLVNYFPLSPIAPLVPSPPVSRTPPTENKATLGKGKKGKNKGKKTRGKYPAEEAAEKEMKEKKTTNAVSSPGKQLAPNLASNPEVKDRGLAENNQQGNEQVTRICATSGGECSGQKMPDCS